MSKDINMEQNIIRKNLWTTAGQAGLAFGAISSAYLFLNQFLGTSDIPGFISSIAGTILWLAKFGGCILLMKFYMKKFAGENPETDNSHTFKLGMAIALLSAIVYAAVSFANVAFISTDMFAQEIDAVMQQMAPMMDSNSISLMDTMMEKMPQITFFSNLIYCFIYGTILSAILSRNIPSKDPFADYKPE